MVLLKNPSKEAISAATGALIIFEDADIQFSFNHTKKAIFGYGREN
jgi:hypothetical protein